MSAAKHLPIHALSLTLFTSLALAVLLPFVAFYVLLWQQEVSAYTVTSLVASCVITIGSVYTFANFPCFPGITAAIYVGPIVLFWSGIVIFVIKLWRLEYSLLYLALSAGILLCYGLVNQFRTLNRRYLFAYIPVGRAKDMPEQIPNVDWHCLQSPYLDVPVNAIVADLHSEALDDVWERFLAEQTLSGVAVYNHRQIRESLTGRVRILHLYENDLGSLLPSNNYMILKRLTDIGLVIISLPITLPVMALAALLISRESDGQILFRQQRVGQGGKPFVMYKFRSMREDAEAKGVKMASFGDVRVTKVGKFIRRTRIDELPQIWNVLKGEMSLIGPRPEQLDFVARFNDHIPFYCYRHIVKPGISGWAQVKQGYAADEDETKIKLEHDFFYIKYVSFSLDLLIFFKTIHTMLTGYGAR